MGWRPALAGGFPGIEGTQRWSWLPSFLDSRQGKSVVTRSMLPLA